MKQTNNNNNSNNSNNNSTTKTSNNNNKSTASNNSKQEMKMKPVISNGSNNKNIKMCSKCNTQHTSAWRREESTYRVLCNACHLRQLRKANRNSEQSNDSEHDSDADSSEVEEVNRGSKRTKEQDGEVHTCVKCGRTSKQRFWNRDNNWELLCGTCSRYETKICYSCGTSKSEHWRHRDKHHRRLCVACATKG